MGVECVCVQNVDVFKMSLPHSQVNNEFADLLFSTHEGSCNIFALYIKAAGSMSAASVYSTSWIMDYASVDLGWWVGKSEWETEQGN